MKVWVLNLKHREDRYNRITKALDKEGVDYEIFHGLYWKDENFKNILKLQDMEIYDKWKLDDGWNHHQKRNVNMGEAAVAASTILMWEKILEEGDDMVLCPQDDTVWEEGKMNKLIELVERNDEPVQESDAVFLCGYSINGYDYKFKPIDDNYETPEYMYNAHAIVYKRNTIEHILANGYRKHLMSLDEYLMILSHTTERMDVAEDLGVVEALKYTKVINSENVLEQINDMDEVISDILDTPEV